MRDEASFQDGMVNPARISTRQEFADGLTLIRERAGLTVRDVAREIEVPPSTIGGYFGGRHLPPVKLSDLLLKILSVCGVDDAAQTELWLAALARVRRAPGRRPATAPVPYRGLKSFEPEDAGWFFGRQRLTRLLLRQLRDLQREGGLLAVVGPSGSGKSSLLRAGLIPALRTGALSVPSVSDGRLALFTPGPHPAAEFARRLDAMPSGDKSSGPVVTVVDQFEEVFTSCCDESERRTFISALCAAAGSAALVIVGLRADFYPHALHYPELVSALQSRQVLVGPMTEEELRSAITGPARKAGLDIEAGLVEVLLRDLAPEADRREPTAAHDAGALPLLSHALLATWELSRGGRLTVADYHASGGIQGAVAASAEVVYAELTPAQQELARRIFVRLVRVADDMADTRRRISRSELPLGDGDGGDLRAVLDPFIEERLITAGAVAGSDTLEIAHEALLHAWPRLRQWIDTDSTGARTHRQLTAAAEAWRDSGCDPSALYGGGRLAAAEEWAALPPHADDLNRLEHEFLDASIERRLQTDRAARRQTRRLRGLSGALAALLAVAGSLAAVAYQQRNQATYQRDLAISRQVATEANQLRGTDIALAMQLSLAAYQISPTAEAISSVLDSTATVPATRILGPAGTEMHSVAISPDGTVLVSGSDDGSVRLWNVRRPGYPVSLGAPLSVSGSVTSIAFAPDSRLLAVASARGGVSLWKVGILRRPAFLDRIPAPPGAVVNSVAFSPGGHTLGAGDSAGRVWLWDVTSPPRSTPRDAPLDTGTAPVNAIAFAPDSHSFAVGTGDGRIALWTVRPPGPRSTSAQRLRGPVHGVNAVAFSPDGRTLAAAGNDSRIWLWTVPQARRPAIARPALAGARSWIYSLAFSPSGRTIAAGSADNNAYLWDVATGELTGTLPHPAPVLSVAYGAADAGSARGAGDDMLATGDADGVARIWALPGPVLPRSPGSVFTVAFSPGGASLALASATASGRGEVRLCDTADPGRPACLGPPLTAAGILDGTVAYGPGGRLAAGGGDGSIHVWDATDARHPVRLTPPRTVLKTAVQYVAFDKTGQFMAAGSTDGTIELWDTARFDRITPLAVLPPGTKAAYRDVFAVAFSPDDRLLASAGADGTVRLWDITVPSRPKPLGPPLTSLTDAVYQVTFSPDGHLLAASGEDGKVRLWDVAEPGRPRSLTVLNGPPGIVYDIAFSPDGRVLATADGDKTVALWDIANPAAPSRLGSLTGPAQTVFSVAFSPDGDTIAAGSQDGTTRLWRATPAAAATYVCAIAGDPVTAAEWARYVPGLPYHPPCQAP